MLPVDFYGNVIPVRTQYRTTSLSGVNRVSYFSQGFGETVLWMRMWY